MLLKFSLLLFAIWLGGAVFLKSSFIHLLLLIAIALATVHLARRHRCGEPLFKL